jgi:DNA-binding MarR family transcriptional regulator
MIGHGTAIRGEKARGAKLSERSVLEMKSLKGKMLQKDIAVKFGVDPTTVSNVFTGKNWAWLE